MSIFGKIKSAIFGKDGGPFGDNYFGQRDRAEAKAGGQPAPQTQTRTVPVDIPAPQPAGQSTAPAAPAASAPVDPEAAIARIAEQKGNPALNWRTSIVDLMKLLDLDSSLENRKELAGELGYTGAKDGSAEMNIWLHRRVMEELGKGGGAVPPTLRD